MKKIILMMTLGLFVLSVSAQTTESNKEVTKTEVASKNYAEKTKCSSEKTKCASEKTKCSSEKTKCASEKTKCASEKTKCASEKAKCSKGDTCCKKTGKTVASCDKKKEGCCSSGAGK
jgi:uncharacterized protein (DUF3084 family)